VSQPTYEVPFLPRIQARPLYQRGWGSVWDPEPSKERVGDGGGPATVWSLLCVAEEALYLPTFSHLFDCQQTSLSLSLSLVSAFLVGTFILLDI
jgi:hypothetical protein